MPQCASERRASGTVWTRVVGGAGRASVSVHNVERARRMEVLRWRIFGLGGCYREGLVVGEAVVLGAGE